MALFVFSTGLPCVLSFLSRLSDKYRPSYRSIIIVSIYERARNPERRVKRFRCFRILEGGNSPFRGAKPKIASYSDSRTRTPTPHISWYPRVFSSRFTGPDRFPAGYYRPDSIGRILSAGYYRMKTTLSIDEKPHVITISAELFTHTKKLSLNSCLF